MVNSRSIDWHDASFAHFGWHAAFVAVPFEIVELAVELVAAANVAVVNFAAVVAEPFEIVVELVVAVANFVAAVSVVVVELAVEVAVVAAVVVVAEVGFVVE